MNRLAFPSCSSSPRIIRLRRCAGLSLIELVLALAITGMLLTATMVALDASFRAYASAAEEASTQSQTRMVTHRLMNMIRTSTALGPAANRHTDNPLTSDYLEMMGADGQEWAIEYDADAQTLSLVQGNRNNGDLPRHLLLSDVPQARFVTHSRRDDDGLWVVDRATVDFTATPPPDTTLALERGSGTPIRVIASTMPRKQE